jgi:hypothetical protein
MSFRWGWLVSSAMVVAAHAACAHENPSAGPLVGTWTLVAADVLRPDGTRAHDYGQAPKGLLIIDSSGRYSLQIYDSSRPRFAAGDKAKATPDEYRAAIMGSSIHFGTISVDAAVHVFVLTPEGASYPNQEGTPQKRAYELDGDQLSYKVAPRPDGSIPISVWRRLSRD